VKRAQAFREYIEHGHAQQERSKINDGIVACAKTAEKILRFLYQFYLILPYCDTGEKSGVNSNANSVLEQARANTARSGFGELIGRFRGLEKHQDIIQATEKFLGRNGIWPKGSEGEPFVALDELNKQRIHLVHPDQPGSNWEPIQLIEGFQLFLDWLLEPTSVIGAARCAESGSCALRIYPAIVALNLQITTRSGITSLRYKLRDTHNDRLDVTLYTMQPVSIESCYYGLPHARTDSHNFWHNPVLIQTDVLTAEDNDVHAEV